MSCVCKEMRTKDEKETRIELVKGEQKKESSSTHTSTNSWMRNERKIMFDEHTQKELKMKSGSTARMKNQQTKPHKHFSLSFSLSLVWHIRSTFTWKSKLQTSQTRRQLLESLEAFQQHSDETRPLDKREISLDLFASVLNNLRLRNSSEITSDWTFWSLSKNIL